MDINSNFRACELKFNNESFYSSIVVKSIDELFSKFKKEKQSDMSDYILVRVSYASVSMSDLISISIAKENGVESKIPGIEFAGIVISSSCSDFPEGSEVISFSCSKSSHLIRFIPGWDLCGAYGEIVCVHKDNLLMAPVGLSLKENVIIGNEGLYILNAISKIMDNNLDNQNVLVILPKYSIGYLALLLLDKAGFDVTVLIDNTNESKYISSFANVKVISKEKFIKGDNSTKFAAIFDMSGGELISQALDNAVYSALVFLCHTHKCFNNTFSIPMKKIMLKNVSFLPIEDLFLQKSEAKEFIYRLVDEWKLSQLLFIAQEIAINELPEYLDKLQKENLKGKFIINYEL